MGFAANKDTNKGLLAMAINFSFNDEHVAKSREAEDLSGTGIGIETLSQKTPLT